MKIKKIHAENYKTYKLLDLNLEVTEDRPIILIGGGNGCGKTTLTNMFIALGAGAVLCFIYYLLTILVNFIRMKRLHNEAIERYIADVLKFE